MDPLLLGLTLAILGIGGTLLVLGVFSLLASLLTRLFPEEAGEAETDASSSGPPAAGA